jgi:galactoside O-acetyltransferase
LGSIIDVLLSWWPTSIGGIYVRRLGWKARFADCAKNVNFGERLTILGFTNIRVGSGTSFMSGSYLYAHEGGSLTIGANCSFNNNVQIAASGGEIVIGDDVLIGPNAVLRAADHEFGDPNKPIRLQGHRRGRIEIGNNVWLAANVVVTSNVRIGDGVVVGAGSVVTNDLPRMTICAGVPAKPIRSRLNTAGAVQI